ncbi:MAG: hypothetical protein NXH72_09620 [Hyphomonadaceae bacterium]|nr:hypothetical protein [Hyphomonadaceae bacterium]
MQWIIANMWMALAAATVLGLLFGFSFRGLLASNRVRKATVEREIAKTELTQAKAEIDALYTAQRKRKEESAQTVVGDDTLRAELDERETRIASLGDELSAARAELEALKSEPSGGTNVLQNVGAAAAGAVAGAVLSDDDQKELTELKDRNAWLESRVASLEADISAAHAAAAETETEPAAVPVVEAAVGPDLEKLNWQNSYLRLRVDSLESKLMDAEATPPAPEPVDPSPAVVAPIPVVDTDEAEKAAADEELARLRWRNRYLEGRLAYFEESADDAPSAETEAMEAPAEPAPEIEAVAESEPAPEPEAEPETEPAPAPEPTAAAEPEVHPSEAMLAELEGVQPLQIEKPSEGGDDLTAITGIGPRIAEVLNGLGIWRFSQIAEWLPENETWIENHLSFKGRVSRENWVGQAKELMVTA